MFWNSATYFSIMIESRRAGPVMATSFQETHKNLPGDHVLTEGGELELVQDVALGGRGRRDRLQAPRRGRDAGRGRRDSVTVYRGLVRRGFYRVQVVPRLQGVRRCDPVRLVPAIHQILRAGAAPRPPELDDRLRQERLHRVVHGGLAVERRCRV